MERLSYFIKEGFKNIWVNRMMTIASVSVLTVCLLLLGTSLLVSGNVKTLITQIESQNQIMVYLKDNLDQNGINAVSDKIKAIDNVSDIVFISKQKALETQKKQLGQNADLLNGYENDNPLPNSYQVKLKKMDSYSDTVKQIAKIAGVASVNQHVEIANKLTNISKMINVVGIWLFILLAVISLFIISNTIKLAVYVRKREINIMKFVGATDSFIRWPFVVEGFLIGIVAAGISLAAQWVVYTGLVSKLFSVLGIISPLVFGRVLWIVAVGFAFSGVLVGVLGSVISVRKYLKV